MEKDKKENKAKTIKQNKEIKEKVNKEQTNKEIEISLENTVKILYSINNNEHSLTMNQSDKLMLFKKYVSVYLQINLEDYNFFHNKKKLSKNSDNKLLKEFMDNLQQIIFTIKLNSKR